MNQVCSCSQVLSAFNSIHNINKGLEQMFSKSISLIIFKSNFCVNYVITYFRLSPEPCAINVIRTFCPDNQHQVVYGWGSRLDFHAAFLHLTP